MCEGGELEFHRRRRCEGEGSNTGGKTKLKHFLAFISAVDTVFYSVSGDNNSVASGNWPTPDAAG